MTMETTTAMKRATRKKLVRFYRPHNWRLARLLNDERFAWEPTTAEGGAPLDVLRDFVANRTDLPPNVKNKG